MVTEYGMSAKVGQVYCSRERRPLFLDVTMGMRNETEYSEATAQLIDQEVRQIMDEQYEVAFEILKTRKDTSRRRPSCCLRRRRSTETS